MALSFFPRGGSAQVARYVARKVEGGTAPSQVLAQVESHRARLAAG